MGGGGRSSKSIQVPRRAQVKSGDPPSKRPGYSGTGNARLSDLRARSQCSLDHRVIGVANHAQFKTKPAVAAWGNRLDVVERPPELDWRSQEFASLPDSET